jgi:diketogulonate reductase-like aldo/keto reductase
LLQGLVRCIGVSNFGIPHLQKLMQTATIKPAVNQIELHPWLQWRAEVAYCQQEGIVLEVRCGACLDFCWACLTSVLP